MKNFFSFFIENYKLTFLLMTLMTIMGVNGTLNIKSESRPPVDFARVSVSTSYPGSSPEEIEDKITTKIEEEIRSVEGVKDIKSVSQIGLSSVNIRIDMDYYNTKVVADDLQRAVQKVQDLPTDILDRPNFIQFNAKEIPVLELALVGPNDSRQRDKIIDELESIIEDDPGVSEVRLAGYRKREFQVLLDPIKMKNLHVGISEVVNAVRRQSQNIPAGFIRIPNNQKLVRVTGQIKEAKELNNIVIRSNFSGEKVLISDIATVQDGLEDPSVLVRVNGEPATLVTVAKKANADGIKTVQQVKEKIDRYAESLPEKFRIVEYNNEGDRIADRLGIVINNANFGLVLVFIIMFLFLPGMLGFVASLSLPLAVLGTVGAMYFWNINFNNITMLAMVIAIGMLVDNSVVISENYARLRLEGMDIKEAAVRAVHQFWVPLTATVLTTIVAFLPMLVTKGIMGQFIRWIPIVVTVALTISIFEGFILLPARLQFTVRNLEKFRDDNQNNKGTWFDKFKNRFESFMALCVRWRYAVLGVVSATLISSILLNVFGNRFELFPAEEVEYYFASFETKITSTIQKTDTLAGDLAKKIREKLGDDKVDYIVSRSGVTQIGTNGDTKNGDYVGMLTIAVPLEMAKTLDPKVVLRQLREIDRGEFTKLVFEVARRGPPVGKPLSVTFRSRSYDDLKTAVKSFKEAISKIDGVVDLEDDEIRGGPEYKLTPNQAAIASLNLNTEKVGTAMRTALQGAFASELTRDGKDFKLKVRYDDENRATLDALRSTYVMEDSAKRLIPLSSVVKVEEVEGPAVRKHYNYKRSISVTSDVDVEKITSIQVNQEAQKALGKILKDFPSVTVTYGGEAESTQESTSSLKNAMIIAIVCIFAIIVFLFHSYLVALLVLSTIPLGLVGVSWAFFLHQKPLSFLALIGIVGLAGVVVNSAIVLVSYVRDLIHDEGIPLHEALAKASSHRLRAVIVTSLTTVGGLFPTAYGWGGYDSILVPMTMALAWGLVSGTLLTLIWVPCGYAIIEDVSSLSQKLIQKLLTKKSYKTSTASEEFGGTHV